ncbi:MAG: hypothetical protein MUF66_00645 [Gammaproteobacteria bacterium]|jgi:hypothetical protein|nr:hypothetical protein [Gammaproteobacteria bacterium]
MNAPEIETAVPARRYQIGDYSAVLLHEISSPGPVRYHFILALVPFGSSTPVLYVTAEQADGQPGEDDTVVRVVAETGERTFGPEQRWRDLEGFAADALEMARRVLGLGGEEVRRLL